MLIDKEYPATHSMSTSWYFVDEDDNVAIFSSDDNGPMPIDVHGEHYVDELCFYDTIIDTSEGKKLNFTDEQAQLIFDNGKEIVDFDKAYLELLVQIDNNQKKLFFDYLHKGRARKRKRGDWDNWMIPICLSEKLGIYLVDFNDYESCNEDHINRGSAHIFYLMGRKAILKCKDLPSYQDFDYNTNYNEEKGAELSSCPYYIYYNDWDASWPHQLKKKPISPLKLEQMPEELRQRVLRLHVKFADTPQIQLSTHYFCNSYISHQKVKVNGKQYASVYLPNKEEVFVFNDKGEPSESNPLFLTREQIDSIDDVQWEPE